MEALGRRIAIVGAAGSGKTTVARRLAARLGVPHVELDSLFHQPGWQPLARDRFRERVAERIAGDGWVVDGNYSAVQDLVWTRAEAVVWLDLPRATVVRRVALRTVRRAVTRQELWNGNREPITGILRLDPEQNIVRWSWTTHPELRERYARAAADPANGHLHIVRLRSQGAIDDLLA